MSLVDLFGGPLDGHRREWPDPLPTEIFFPVFRRRATVWEGSVPNPFQRLPIRVMVYRHRSLGAYDFVEERDK